MKLRLVLSLVYSFLLFNLNPASADYLDELPPEVLIQVLNWSEFGTIAQIAEVNWEMHHLIHSSYPHLPTAIVISNQIEEMKKNKSAESVIQSLDMVDSFRTLWSSQKDSKRNRTLRFLKGADQKIINQITSIYSNLGEVNQQIAFFSKLIPETRGKFELHRALINFCGESDSLLKQLAQVSEGNAELQDKIFAQLSENLPTILSLAHESRGNIGLQSKIFDQYQSNMEVLVNLANASHGNHKLQADIFRIASQISGDLPSYPKWTLIRGLGSQAQGNKELQSQILQLYSDDLPLEPKSMLVEGLILGSTGNFELQNWMERVIHSLNFDLEAHDDYIALLKRKLYRRLSDDCLSEDSAKTMKIKLRDQLYHAAKSSHPEERAKIYLALSKSDQCDPVFQDKLIKTILLSRSMNTQKRAKAMKRLIFNAHFLSPATENAVRNYARLNLDVADRTMVQILLMMLD